MPLGGSETLHEVEYKPENVLREQIFPYCVYIELDGSIPYGREPRFDPFRLKGSTQQCKQEFTVYFLALKKSQQ